MEELKKESPDKPIIILAHHAMEYLHDDEKREVEGILSNYPVRLYLCGDAHKLWGRRINDHLEITMGCMVQENWGGAAFSVGEMRGGAVSVEAHKWEKEGVDPDWTPFTNFNEKFSRNDTEVITKLSPVSSDTNFLGRKAKIDEIEYALFHRDRMVLLYGMSGIGKTEICREIFEGYQTGPSIVKKLGWITYQNTIKDSFWEQFPMLNKVKEKLPSEQDNSADRDYTPVTHTKEAYWDAAKELLDRLGEELLLVIDNANEITQREILMLEQLHCRLLLTSRSDLERAVCIDVGQLEWEDCRQLYRIHSEDTIASDKIISDIIALAARHTLLIELLAKLQYATGQTAEQLYQRLCEKGFDLSDVTENISYLHNPEIDPEGEWDRRFTDHVEMLFDISGICSKKEELEILQFFSLSCSGCAVPLRTVQTWMGLPDLNHLNALVKEGWLNRGNKNGVPTVEMHPLVYAAVCRIPDPDEKRVTEWVKNMADDIRIKDNETAEDKQDFISFASEMLAKLPDTNIEYIELLASVAGVYLNNGEYGKALVLYEQALKMARKLFGEKHLYIAKTYNAIGTVHDGLREYKEALSWFQKGYKMLEKLLGTSHTDTAASYCNVATIYLKLWKYNEARPWLEKAFAIQEAWPDKEHSANTAVIYATKGYACTMTLRLNEAISWYKKAVEIQQEVSGEGHPTAMEIKGNIAKIYQMQGKYDEALEIYHRVCEVQERRRGKKHPNTTSIYRNIGNVYRAMRCYHEALDWIEKALKIREEILGKEHISTAILYNDVGIIYCEQGKFSKALEYFMKALPIHEKMLGVADQNTKNVYRNLAVTYLSCGRCLKAWGYWRKYWK